MTKIFRYTIDENRLFQIQEQPQCFIRKSCRIGCFQIDSQNSPEIIKYWLSDFISVFIRGRVKVSDFRKCKVPEEVSVPLLHSALEKYCEVNKWICFNERTERVIL